MQLLILHLCVLVGWCTRIKLFLVDLRGMHKRVNGLTSLQICLRWKRNSTVFSTNEIVDIQS